MADDIYQQLGGRLNKNFMRLPMGEPGDEPELYKPFGKLFWTTIIRENKPSSLQQVTNTLNVLLQE